MILKLQHFIFFYSAGEKQKIGGKYYFRKLARGKQEKKG